MHEDKLASYLEGVHRGAKSSVSGAVLARNFEISGNQLMHRVNRLRRESIPIASSRNGYFYAETAGEVYATIRRLERMEAGIRAAIDGLINSLDGFGGAGK